MCGIAGVFSSTLRDFALEKMAEAMSHRGPDALGVKRLGACGLVHARLNILDLTPTGAQPMANEDESVWTVFNGEIYNYGPIRDGLIAHGHVMRGTSDTEILPHLWEEDGPKLVDKLRGMFTVAIWDTQSETLLLARDRFGIKPLFYAQFGDTLAFASEINSLRPIPGIDWTPEEQAICDYTALLYVPGPATFYRGVKCLLPGQMLVASRTSSGMHVTSSMFHTWSLSPNGRMTMPEASERTMALLDAGVASQLRSDVPLGSLLSGGIDSSLVSESAQRALGGSLNTYNVQFSDAEFDETWAAKAVAEHIHSHHEVLPVEPQGGSWESVCSFLLATGQPFSDTSMFAVNGVCRHMRKHVTVALSGDGGDEGFGGYNTYWQIARIARYQQTPGILRTMIRMATTGASAVSPRLRRIVDRMRDFEYLDDTSVMQNLFCWLRQEEQLALLPMVSDNLPVRRHFEPSWDRHLSASASRVDRLSAHLTEVDVRMSLPNDFLFKVDIASMQESLEVRVPMLDEDLFDFGLTLPHALKVEGHECKRVLRQVAHKRLPHDVAEKAKRGFGIPVDIWVDGDFKNQLRSSLISKASPLWDVLNRDVGTKLIEAFCDGQPTPNISRQGLYQRAIMLLSLHLHLGGAK